MGGKAISCGFLLRSLALYQAAVVANTAAEEEMAVSESVVHPECLAFISLRVPPSVLVYSCLLSSMQQS